MTLYCEQRRLSDTIQTAFLLLTINKGSFQLKPKSYLETIQVNLARNEHQLNPLFKQDGISWSSS